MHVRVSSMLAQAAPRTALPRYQQRALALLFAGCYV